MKPGAYNEKTFSLAPVEKIKLGLIKIFIIAVVKYLNRSDE